ncbi:MAG TPA: aminoacyl-tRNA hydrolase, partial [Planctomycetes bacterium]|nr:aminoacyl-tRNA hydrolase [Planctomycetota bacterium]
GSAGGQKGLNDIIQRLGHDQFPRLRIGVGRPPGRMDVTAWVLGRFREDEKENIEHAVVRAADSVERWIAEGIEPTMVEYNRQVSED